MNLTKHKGLVLRSFLPQKQKFSIFDSQLGKISCVIHKNNGKLSERIRNGSIIDYYPKPLHTVYELHEVELVDMPTEFARHNIYFLHHVLELCYFFLPEQLESNELFALIYQLFIYKAELWTVHAQKIFLVKFFALLGVFPEEITVYKSEIYRLISGSVESMLKKDLNVPIEKEIDTLIHACIGTHPYKNQFKTIHFIARMDDYEGKKP